jgi:hypothetical protein
VVFYSHLQSNIYVVMIKLWIYIVGFIVMIQKKKVQLKLIKIYDLDARKARVSPINPLPISWPTSPERKGSIDSAYISLLHCTCAKVYVLRSSWRFWRRHTTCRSPRIELMQPAISISHRFFIPRMVCDDNTVRLVGIKTLALHAFRS